MKDNETKTRNKTNTKKKQKCGNKRKAYITKITKEK